MPSVTTTRKPGMHAFRRTRLLLAGLALALAAFSAGCDEPPICDDSDYPLLCPNTQTCCPPGSPYRCSDDTCTSTPGGCAPAVNDDFCS
jgi:hypothetical protein